MDDQLIKVVDKILTSQEAMSEMLVDITSLLKTYDGRLAMLEAAERGEEPTEWADR